MCHKPLTPFDALVFRQKNYSTDGSFWGFLLAVPSNFYRTALIVLQKRTTVIAKNLPPGGLIGGEVKIADIDWLVEVLGTVISLSG